MKKAPQFFMIVVLAVVLSLGIHAVPGAAKVLEQVSQGLVDGVFGPGSAPAKLQEAQAPVPPVVGQGVINLGAEAFTPYNTSTTFARQALMLYPTGAINSYTFDATLNLPQGSQVNQVVMYFEDNDASHEMTVFLVSSPTNSDTGTAIGQAVTSGANVNIRNVTITSFVYNPLIIDNASNNYFVRVNIYSGGQQFLKSVRVEYSYMISMPSVVR